jgi:hypothetical protein
VIHTSISVGIESRVTKYLVQDNLSVLLIASPSLQNQWPLVAHAKGLRSSMCIHEWDFALELNDLHAVHTTDENFL